MWERPRHWHSLVHSNDNRETGQARYPCTWVLRKTLGRRWTINCTSHKKEARLLFSGNLIMYVRAAPFRHRSGTPKLVVWVMLTWALNGHLSHFQCHSLSKTIWIIRRYYLCLLTHWQRLTIMTLSAAQGEVKMEIFILKCMNINCMGNAIQQNLSNIFLKCSDPLT